MTEQGSPEWFAERLGKATASRIADIVAKTKSGYSTSRANYAAQLIVERLTGQPVDSYQNAAMLWGIETEPDAVAAYEFYQGAETEKCGFVDHPSIPMSGASPDRLIGEDGLLEVKCPISATHIDTLLNGTVPDKYVVQMNWQMACTGRRWCDWASFDPRMPEDLRLYVERFWRDDDRITKLEAEVTEFLREVDQKESRLRKLADAA